jgi:hypothetical protein
MNHPLFISRVIGIATVAGALGFAEPAILQRATLEELKTTAVAPGDGKGGTPDSGWKACAQRAYPDGGDSDADILRKFAPPNNTDELLHNLKRAADGDWMVQPMFADEATLRSFFNSTKVTWIQRKPAPT